MSRTLPLESMLNDFFDPRPRAPRAPKRRPTRVPFKHVRETATGQASAALGEHNDCTVKALAIASGMGYGMAHRLLELHGRRPRHRMFGFGTVCARFKWLERVELTGRPTLNQFVKAFPCGRYVAHVRGHAFAVIDGVVYDYAEGARRVVQYAYRYTGAPGGVEL